MRIQLALNVKDLGESVAYYSRLFGVEPHKQRPGYANFAIDKPALKLVLFENPAADQRINHLGVELETQEQLDTAIARLTAEGIDGTREDGTVCCHAEQNKIWSAEPDGIEWEWYRITDDQPGQQPAAE